MWAVQLGIGGLLLLLAFFGSLVRDAWPFPAAIRHATLSLVAMLAATCLFNSIIFDALIGDYFCVLLGLLLTLGLLSETPPQPP